MNLGKGVVKVKAKYAKVYESLVERIAKMEPGDRLDSEVQLAEDFDVSPMTVRRALQLLSQEGRTVGVPGSGTYVTEKGVLLNNGSDELKRSDIGGLFVEPELTVQLVSATMDSASASERRFLEISDRDFVLRILRSYRLADHADTVMGAELITVAADDFPGALGGDLTGNIVEMLAGCAKGLHGPMLQEAAIYTGDEVDAALNAILPRSGAGMLTVERTLKNSRGRLCGTIQTVLLSPEVRLVLG